MDSIVYPKEAENGEGDSSNLDELQPTRASCALPHLLLREQNAIMANPMLTIED
jgi:hypothetical protein